VSRVLSESCRLLSRRSAENLEQQSSKNLAHSRSTPTRTGTGRTHASTTRNCIRPEPLVGAADEKRNTIVLSRSPASTISDDDHGCQTAARTAALLSHSADAFPLARSAVSKVGSCYRAQVELPRKYHKDFGRYADVYPVNRCAFEEDKDKPVPVEAGWTCTLRRRRLRPVCQRRIGRHAGSFLCAPLEYRRS
jgi:hypothetical protein